MSVHSAGYSLETLHMTAAEREGEAFVTGAHDRGVCFDARLSFVPEP